MLVYGCVCDTAVCIAVTSASGYVVSKNKKGSKHEFLAYLGFWHLGIAKSANKLVI